MSNDTYVELSLSRAEWLDIIDALYLRADMEDNEEPEIARRLRDLQQLITEELRMFDE